MEFELAKGWKLRLKYHPKPPGFEKVGSVTAEFIPRRRVKR
jgi:hypothetical protein